MFTGIIQELGTIAQITRGAEALQLKIKANKILKDINVGDSIAINGVCLTVTIYDKTGFTVDVMPETHKATSLAGIMVNAQVNLEPALDVGGRLGGHFVTGHVDGVGEIVRITTNSNAIEYQIKLAPDLLHYCIYKGSIAVDGTSLTIFGVDATSIKLALIPHTVANTVLGQKKVGDLVNIECDMLAKYIERLLPYTTTNASKISKEFLSKHDFI